MEMVLAVIEAAQRLQAPVILQTTPSSLRYAEPAIFHAMAQAAARTVDIPVCLHLDHGDTAVLAFQAMALGYTSVMIDGSRLPYEENIALTRRVVKEADNRGIPVEGELGAIGGKEDDLAGGNGGYTVPDLAADFIEKSGVSSLAVAIGTAHGLYKTKPRLDIDRLRDIRKATHVPLVLHGASGLADEDIRQCIRAGICKVNFATELRIAYTNGVRETLTGEVFDPKAYGRAGRERVRAAVESRMRVYGCVETACKEAYTP